MSYDPPLAYRVHRIALVVLYVVVVLLFGLGVWLVYEPVWEQILEMIEGTRRQWSSM
jgi:predicted PurR-regulated permease PerM